MRRQSTEQWSQGTRLRSRDEMRGASAKRSRLRRLTLEGLEARTLLATTPIPVVANGSQVQASAGITSTTINDSSPSIAVDPLDSSKLVAVFTERDTESGTTEYSAVITYSTNGGLSWQSVSQEPSQQQDPTSTTFKLLQDYAEGVGFDRNNNFYVGVLETNGSNAGAVAVNKYSFSGAAPTLTNGESYYNNPAYSWNQTITGQNLQPSVVDFSMAVDDNVSTFVDPSTGVVQSDPNSGAVYIAWTLDTPPPSSPPNPYNPYTISVVASSDGTTWGGGLGKQISGGNAGHQAYAYPQIAVSQGKAGGSDGGLISVVYDDYGTGSFDGSNLDYIDYASLTYSGSGGSPAILARSQVTTTTVRGAQTGTNFPLATPSSPIGIGPGAVIAVDNTLGSFSAFDGRIYVAYVNRYNTASNPSDNTDVFLEYSDNDGQTWNSAGQVNSDNAVVDGHTGAVDPNDPNSTNDANHRDGRPQYEPSIAVDNSTGTLVMSWLDVRDDASLDRYANYLTTSITGGASFSPQTFADPSNTVKDATTNKPFVVGPYSGNESGGNPYAETSTAFGVHQGLAVSGGVVHPAWSTILQGGRTKAESYLIIETAQVNIPSGPRIISGTEGPTATSSFSSFDITFDRPVSIASFTAASVQVQYLDALTDSTSPVALASTNPIMALNPQGAQSLEATVFQINLAQTQTGVGTYSYSIGGSNIRDLVRTSASTTAFLGDGPLTESDGPAASFTEGPVPTSASASIVVSGVPTGDRVDPGQPVTVSGVTISYSGTGTPLTLELTSPSGQTVVLATNIGAVSDQTFTTNAFSFLHQINGAWTLTVLDSATGTAVGALSAGWGFGMSLLAPVAASASSPGNLMDQNPAVDNVVNGTKQKKGNYYANPTPLAPVNNTPFAGPYDTTTLPIIIGGPRVVSSFVTGGTTDPTGSAQPGNNLMLNGIVSSIDVTFDEPMDPATFTPSQVLSMMGPAGPIAGPFTVVPDPQPLENPSFPKTFKIGFPAQQLSGTYNLTLGAGIKSQIGVAVDTNQNAGVDLLFDNVTATLPAGPSTFTSTQSATIAPGTPAVPSSVSTSITVPANDISLIADFSLQLNILYPNDPDLTATLTTPGNQTVLLFGGNGSASGSQANFTNTVFQDSAATLIGNGAPPFLGQFKPRQSLLVGLAGQSEAGTYTLTIMNTGSGTGTLTGWSITATPETTTNTGLGEPVADQTTASFRIFTMDPTNPLSSNTWTPVGPASANVGTSSNSGRVSAITVDPSDPSGNTVYVAGASGGVWKTTDFLTTAADGPTYTLLTGDSEADALNIGSIAVYGRNNDPNQSIIVAGTGEGNTAQPGVQGSSTVGTSAGVGFLISYDGGKTWTLDDSLVNYDASGNELPEAQRDHTFVGTSTYKVIIDPHTTPSGNIIIYAALGGGQGGTTGQGGLYRSVDSGHTWTLMKAGYATDVVFDPNSGTINAVNTTGNLLTLYAAFLGQGVFLSPNQGQTWSLMGGGVGDPLIQDVPLTGHPAPVPVNAPGATPSSGGGRIVLAKPALLFEPDGVTPDKLRNAEYETWLYAAVVNPDGSFNGLFVTKDNGANWTDVRLPNTQPAAGAAVQGLVPSNNVGLSNYNITGGQGNYDLALAVDPNDPSVVYVGGSADFGPTTLVRVDITRLADPYSLYASTETTGGQILPNTTSPISVPSANLANFSTNLQLLGFDPLSNPYTNLYRDPKNVFASNSVVEVRDTNNFSNDGSGAWYTPFDSFINGTDVHTIVPIVDPTTGKTRLLVGYDQGIASAIDDGNGSVVSSIGTQTLLDGVANGNIQITQFYNGAAQPSALAAQVAGALFYGMAQDDGFPVSDPNLLTDGNIGWNGSPGDGTDVATDQTGSGTIYQSTWPCCNTLSNPPNSPNDFFQVANNRNQYTNGVDPIGRTFGLIQSTSVPPAGGLPGTSDPQWGAGPSYNFAVNPVDNQEMIIGSAIGNLFVTQDQGVIWTDLSASPETSTFDGTTIPALAYGAPAVNATGSTLGNYMIVGTTGGHIYVTFTGGGNGTSGTNAWIDISGGLDGSSVQRIVTDPTRGTFDAYAITSTGVFYNPNTAAANSAWVNITGDLFQQTTTPFGDAALTTQALLNLGGLAVDWRYVIPFDPTNPSKGTHPMLYVAGVGGVLRSTNNGTNWTSFPDQTLATPVANGNLPAVTVTDLDMVLGNVDPTTGHPDVSTGPNLLLATTYGSGSYGIRLAPIVFNDSTNKVTESQDTTTGVLTFKGLSEQSAFGTSVTVTVEDVTDPNNPVPLGTGQTDVNGKFSVTGSYPAPPAGNPFFFDGTRKVEIFATDASGTKGNVVTFQITNSLPAPTSGPVFVNANDSAPPLTNGVVSAGTVITTSSPLPTFQFTVPNPGLGQTIAVTLIRVDSQQNTVPVAGTTLNGTNSGSTLTGFLQDPGPLAVGAYTYEFQYTVTVAGQPTNSPISPGTTVQVVAPMAAPNLYFLDDSGVVGDGITNVTKPRFTGTAIPNAANDPALMLELVETAYTSNLTGVPVPLPTPVVLSAPVVDPVNGQYLLQPTTALADGVYTLVVVATDAAGDVITSAATKPPTLTISTQGPKIVPTIALLPASDVPSNNPNATVVRRPYVHGSTDPGAVVTIYGSVDGGPKIPLATTTANLTTGAYQVQLPSFLNDGTVTLYASAANAAGNTNPKQGTFTLQIISVPGDYTGVGAAGAAIYSPSTGNYTFEHAVTGGLTVVYGFGLPNVDIPVPGDYNGDGQTDPAIYRPTNGWWAVDVNSQAAGQYVLYVPPIIPPAPGIIPVPADYDTNGQTDPAVYSIVPYNGINYGVYTILHNLVSGANTSSLQSIAWGIAGDMPVPGNYDGAGAAQVAVYRPSTGAWYIRSSGVGGGAATPAGTREPTVFVTAWKAGDVPDAANYDGIVNGTTKVGQLEEAIYRPSTETFYIYNPTTKTTRQVTMPKLAGQGPNDVIIPASADFTGDGRADAAIYDQTLGTFEYINSATGAVVTHHFTLTSGDIPLTAPEPYRAAANAAGAGGAQAAFLKAGAFLAAAPASSSGSATPAAAGTGTGSTAAAVVVGATVPTGLTSTGKTSTLPPAPVPTPAPITLITSGNSVNRPAQGDATDSAIASLGQSYKGTFI